MLNRILTLALMLSVVICCIFVFTEAPPELERTGPLPILMYHDVTDGPTSDNPMVVTTEKLEGDLCWLKENGDYFAKGVNGVQRKTGESSWQFQMRVLTDLKKSRDILQRELGTAPQLFAYPYGETEPDAEAYLRRLFPMTVITGRGEIGTLEGRYHLPRISVCQETQLGDRLL